jgi:hypothetical protein
MDDPGAHDVAAVIMVMSTPEASAVLQRSGLSASQLLEPFATVEDPGILVQTTSEPYRLQRFQMRFQRAADIRETSPEDSERQLTEVASRWDAAQPLAPRSAAIAPWLGPVREALAWQLRYAEHSGHDYPVACLFIGAVSQPQLVSAFNGLYASGMPPVLRDGLCDPTLARCFLLLDDAAAAVRDAQLGKRVLQEVGRAFGAAACHLLTVNSSNAPRAQPHERWARCAGGSSGVHSDVPPAGALMSDADARELGAFVSGPLCRTVVNHLQHRLRQLEAIVKEKRQGLKNTFRLWLGGKKVSSPGAAASVLGNMGSAASGGGGGAAVPRYLSTSIEAHMRQIADYAFFLADYSLAHSYYRSAASEFKSDKAWRHYAHAQEMAARCLAMQGGSKRELGEALDKAVVSYLRSHSVAGDGAARFATAATLRQLDWTDYTASRARTREVARNLVNQSTNETGLMSALLLEQAARCFGSFAAAPMHRQYALYMILAGFRFLSCQQRRYAVRAYAAALRVYEGRGWHAIESHVNAALARNYASLNMADESVDFFIRLLRSTAQPADRQAMFLRELCSIVSQDPRAGPMAELPLPRFRNGTIRVLLNDNVQLSPAAGAAKPAATATTADGAPILSVAHPLWSALVEPLLPSAEVSAGNWLTGRTAPAASARLPCAVVGEWVLVSIEVENPSHLQLELQDVRLRCEHTPEREAAAGALVAGGAVAGGGLRAVGTDGPLDIDMHQLVLAPGAVAQLELGVRPLAEGGLRLLGVDWTLQSALRGSHILVLQGRRLNITKQQRTGREYAFSQSLALAVTNPMPVLRARLEGMPASLLHGQMCCVTLHLKNDGSMAITGLQARVSHPAFCVLGVGVGARLPPPPATSAAAASSDAAVVHRRRELSPSAPAVDPTKSSIPLPSGAMQPGQSMQLPLWVRAAALGVHDLHIVFCHEPEAPSQLLKRRISPLSARLRVSPSVAVEASLRPAHSCPQTAQHILALGLRNASEGARLRVSQVSCISAAWQLQPLCRGPLALGTLLRADECTLHLRLSPAADASPSLSGGAGSALAGGAVADDANNTRGDLHSVCRVPRGERCNPPRHAPCSFSMPLSAFCPVTDVD